MNVESAEPVHPGLELARLFAETSINSSQFADQVGLSRPLVSQITLGNRRITKNTAIKIANYFENQSALDWLERQRRYDIWKETKAVQTEVNVG